jgi:CIC family chloride channel protein
MGATLGGAYGLALRACFPGLHVDPAALALAGMAGLIAGSTGAALTAIVMIFEMTLDYSVVLPMTLTVAVAYGLRRILLAETMYTMKLARRGHPMPWALQANAYLVHQVTDLSVDKPEVLPGSTRGELVAVDAGATTPEEIVLTDDQGRVMGVLSRSWVSFHRDEIRRAEHVSELARRDFVIVAKTATWAEVLATLHATHASLAIVVSPLAGGADDVLGIITKSRLVEALAEGLELFGD